MRLISKDTFFQVKSIDEMKKRKEKQQLRRNIPNFVRN